MLSIETRARDDLEDALYQPYLISDEHSRVILPDSEWDPLSSYINANYIRVRQTSIKSFIHLFIYRAMDFG